MLRLRLWVRKFFGFSRTETNAFLLLLPLMVIFLFSEPIYRWWKFRHPPDRSQDERALDSIMTSLQWDVPDTIATFESPVERKFVAFDPNQITGDEFTQLGLSPPISKRVVRYREKGGVFRKKEDLLKIYGMDSSWYQTAKAWINLPEKKKSIQSILPTEKKYVALIKVDINSADSIQLIKVYGIGPALSKRIRSFRDKLGGFISMEQLKEVYGLDSTVVQRLKTKFMVEENFQPQKIQLNSISLEDLVRHPYFSYKEARAILAYRLQHGNFQSIDQLRKIHLLTPEWIEKVRNYLLLDNQIRLQPPSSGSHDGFHVPPPEAFPNAG